MNEIATLTCDGIDLAGATVTVKAINSKHRRQDVVPIRAEMVELLREQVAGKTPSARVFKLPNRFRILDAFHADCQTAKIARHDDSGRVVDFHALRHTFISSLAAAGVHPKTAQVLARHSTISLTMDRYTHTIRGAEAAALDALPDYSTPPVSIAIAGNGTPQSYGDTHGDIQGQKHVPQETTGGNRITFAGNADLLISMQENSMSTGPLLGAGVEPALLSEQEPKSCASASFATRAGSVHYGICRSLNQTGHRLRPEKCFQTLGCLKDQGRVCRGELIGAQERRRHPLSFGNLQQLEFAGDMQTDKGVEADMGVRVFVLDGGQ
jgi:hypothetical protein